ncbi:MAG: hypothetical protein V3T83_09845, partial [Acidobacteriota bacterium]
MAIVSILLILSVNHYLTREEVEPSGEVSFVPQGVLYGRVALASDRKRNILLAVDVAETPSMEPDGITDHVFAFHSRIQVEDWEQLTEALDGEVNLRVYFGPGFVAAETPNGESLYRMEVGGAETASLSWNGTDRSLALVDGLALIHLAEPFDSTPETVASRFQDRSLSALLPVD